MYPVIGRCPICHGQLAVTRLHCSSCGTSLEGSFSLGPLQRLNQDQIRFVEAFIRSRGSLKDVGAELNISYPTVNSRLNDILVALGYSDRVKVPEPPDGGALSSERKREILSNVREGKISAAEAERLLRARAQERIQQ
ncbi:MAG: DUF2089 domain-containing protein [Chloroflexi bacterium]|nr:DUF2089 domain-containing protein [Chloroflexota bacterium]